MTWFHRTLALLTGGLIGAASARAEVLVDLDATALPTGSLVTWPNTGSLGNFVREVHTPLVTEIDGVRGVTLDGDRDWYVGPTAPASVTGNSSRAIYAWVYNPSHNVEETVVSWSRRGGPAGTHMALNHGNHPTWGAVAHWDAPDMSWKGREEAGAWTCIAYSYDGTTGHASIFTNGELSERRLVGPLNTHATSTTGQPLAFVVGCENLSDGSRSNSGLPGSMTIAKIQIHDTPLSAAAIAEKFNADAPHFGRTPVAVPVGVHQFAAAAERIFRGDSVELSWTIAGATGMTISPEVAPAPGTNSVVVMPLETTTYTLTATGPDGSDSKSLTVVVEPGLPVAFEQSVITGYEVPVAVTLMAEDPNPPAGGLIWEVVTPPSSGSLSGIAPALVYTPNPGFSGADQFAFTANDGHESSNTATFSIQVSPPPTAPTAITMAAASAHAPIIPGGFIGNLRSSDVNIGNTHHYQFVEGPGDTHNNQFAIIGNQLLAGPGFALAAGSQASVRIRTTDSDGLSYEETLGIALKEFQAGIVVNELYYDPPNNARTQFIELHNAGEVAVDLSGWAFTRGISYTFPSGTVMEPDSYRVVAMDPVLFLHEFGFVPLGPFGGRLASQGETVTLSDQRGAIVDEVSYKAEFPWPISPSGSGSSMELIHPALDNDLAGSWRASVPAGGPQETVLVSAAASGWRYRNGLTQPSSPVTAWRQAGFIQDASWLTGRAPIGYGVIDNLPLNTVVSGMQGNYRSFFARKTFTLAAGEIPAGLLLKYSADDGIIIWINGTEVARRNVTASEPALTANADALGVEGRWHEIEIANAASFLTEGTNVVAVRVLNQSLTSSDVGFDLELIRPGAQSVLKPTPAARNSVFSEAAPPQIRQVGHTPQQPAASQAITIMAKITDPQGVGQVRLHYQIVAPGNFIPARFPRTVPQVMAAPKGPRPVNPAFENPANWVTLPMADTGADGDVVAGDGVFTAVIPPQAHRTLVRYRISASDLQGTEVRVPYQDDPSLNFACFVYDGVPDYHATAASVDPAGRGKIWPKELLESLPVYHWIIRNQDMMTLQAYNSSEQFSNNGSEAELLARRSEEWEGAFVYDGIVYDHVATRLRGGNSRYGDFDGRFPRGKRHYKFKFNKGHEFQDRDEAGNPYPEKRKSVAFSRMFGTKGGNSWGLPEEIGATLWSTLGVPAPTVHWSHFRVIDGAAEAQDQYHGDFWGLVQIVEEYDSRFLDANHLNKGNLYKMSDWIWDAERQRRYQSPDMVRDGSEFNNIRDNLHGGQTAAWLQSHVNYDSWYRYSAVAEAIRHYDVFPFTSDIRHALKNLAWHFEPVGSDPTRGVVTFLPYDWDASFGPSFNNGWDHATNAIYGWSSSTQNGMSYINKPEMKIEHRNVLREFRDLVWQPDQINGLLDHRAQVIAEFSKADQDRWRNAPSSAGTANDDPLEFKVRDMKNFSFTGWSGGSGPSVGAGGRGAHLDTMANSPDAGFLPNRPTISYVGAAGHPSDRLAFQSTAFSDPQGPGSFAAMEWRIGRIHDPSAPAHDPDGEFVLEYTPVWQSGRLTDQQRNITVPVSSALPPGLSYRARVRMQDNSGRWSRWSAPYQFTAAQPVGFDELRENLVISEMMYNPAGPAFPGGSKEDYEYIELHNISETLALDLSGLRFTRGITYDFSESSIQSLAPGGYVLIVKNLAAFEERHGSGLPVAGAWNSSQNLSNSGERIVLTYGADFVIQDFTYGDRSPWPTTPDGSGPSLVLVDPRSRPDHSLAENWRASDAPGGSPGGPDSRFAAWLAGRGESDANAEGAPGMSHALIYALGADALANPLDALPRAGTVREADGLEYATLRYRRRLDANEIFYVVETSRDLEVWESGPEFIKTYGAPIFNADGTETLRVRATMPIEDEGGGFLRLRISATPE